MATTTKCRGCSADLVWKKTKADKTHPVDVPRVKLLTEDGEMVEVRVVRVTGRTEDGRVVHGLVSHFSTCPDAAQFSGRGKGA